MYELPTGKAYGRLTDEDLAQARLRLTDRSMVWDAEKKKGWYPPTMPKISYLRDENSLGPSMSR